MTLIETECKLLVDGVKRGLRQGDPLCTTLFYIMLKRIIRESEIRRRGTLFNYKNQCLAYADSNQRTKTNLFEALKELEHAVKNKGVTINSNADEGMEIQKRVAKNTRCVGGLRDTLVSINISWNAKMRIYKTIIQNSVTYGSEQWALNQKEKYSVEIWERKALKKNIWRGKSG